MVVLVIFLTGYALALPFVQDNRGRRQNNRTQRNANTAPARNTNTPQNNSQRCTGQGFLTLTASSTDAPRRF